MVRLDFDFHARSARPGKLALALLLAGAAAMAWAWSNLQTARTHLDEVSTQIAALEQARQRTATQPKAATRTDASAYSHITALLDYAWQPAFDALAAARSDKIALVSLDAIQAKSQLKLVAEARQLADAIAFIEALQQQPGVKRATLIQHEVQADAVEKPVRFNILVELGA